MHHQNLTQEQLEMMFSKAISFEEPVVGEIRISCDTKRIGLNELISPDIVSHMPPGTLDRGYYAYGFDIKFSFINGSETATLSRSYDKISDEVFYHYSTTQSFTELSVYALKSKTYSFVASSEQFGMYIRMLLSE